MSNRRGGGVFCVPALPRSPAVPALAGGPSFRAWTAAPEAALAWAVTAYVEQAVGVPAGQEAVLT